MLPPNIPTVDLTATSNSDPISVDSTDEKEQVEIKALVEKSKPSPIDAVPVVVTIKLTEIK